MVMYSNSYIDCPDLKTQSTDGINQSRSKRLRGTLMDRALLDFAGIRLHLIMAGLGELPGALVTSWEGR